MTGPPPPTEYNPEMAAVTPLFPAIRLPDGTVHVGASSEIHGDIMQRHRIERGGADLGFVDREGNYLDREQAEQVLFKYLGGRVNVGEELHSDLVGRVAADPERYKDVAIPYEKTEDWGGGYSPGLDAIDLAPAVSKKMRERIVVHGSHPERKVVPTAELNDGTIVVDTDVSSHLDLVEAHGIPYENVKRLGVRRNGKYEWDSEAPQIDDEGYIHSSEAFDEDQAKTAMREDLEREGKLPNPLEQRIKEKRAKKPKKEE